MTEEERRSQFNGHWTADGQPTNLNEFMVAVKVPFIAQRLMRKFSTAADIIINIEGTKITVDVVTKMKSQHREFEIGYPEKVMEKNMVGRKNWARFEWKGEKLVEHMTAASGVEFIIIREILDENTLRASAIVTPEGGEEIVSESFMKRVAE